MKLRLSLVPAVCLLSLLLVGTAFGQQSPVLSVSVVGIDSPALTPVRTFANENYGAVGDTIAINVLAVGTFPATGFTYTFACNGQTLGKIDAAPPTQVVSAPWTPPEPGVYFISVTATDGVNTATSLAVRFFAVGTKITSPLAGTLVPNGSSVVIQAAATPVPSAGSAFVARVDFYGDGVLIGSDSTFPYSAIYTPSASPNHTVRAVAWDNQGNQVGAGDTIPLISVNAIGVPPSVKIATPPHNEAIPIPTNGGAIPVSVSADSLSGVITKVELYVDGQLFGTDTTFPYGFEWLPTVVGTYKLVALAYDDKNNVVASSAVAGAGNSPVPTSVIIAAPPTVVLKSPAAGSTVTGGSPVQLTAVASSSGTASIVNVKFFVDSEFVGQATVPISANTFTYGATLKLKRDENGLPIASSITALATDSNGLSGLSPAVSVAVTDGGGGGGSTIGQPPSVELTWPASGTELAVNRPQLLMVNAADTDGNIVSVQMLANNTNVATLTVYPYTATWTPTNPGSYALTTIVVDNDGNAVTSVPVRVSVVDPAPNPPAVRITSPLNAATLTVGTTQTLRVSATDAVSVKSVQFFVNGEPVGSPTTAYPFTASWTPPTPGIYTLSARAINAAGNPGTSPAIVVSVEEGAGEAVVFTGTYQGRSEAGNFALVAGRDNRATFLAYSTMASAAKTYAYTDLPVDAVGGFSSSAISGSVGETGVSGKFDADRLTFIGFDTRHFPVAAPVATGLYSGSFSGRTGSTVRAIIGKNGSITLFASDAAFGDAGSGTVDGAGAFSIATARGNRFTGTANPMTRELTGALSGPNGGNFTIAPAVSLGSNQKITGAAIEVLSDIHLPSLGHTYDQVLLQGSAASVTADPGQITRVSFTDLSGDIVQVEFSGAGRLSLSLANASAPAPAANYNQPGVAYVKGHASIVITGADETTNVSVFTVGRITTGQPAIIKDSVVYDGVADLGSIAILSPKGRFGGLRAANTAFVAAQGRAGICAPGVAFDGPVFVGDITASDTATPMLLLGSAADVRITGGDFWQANGKAVQISGIDRLKFVDGTTSAGVRLTAQIDRSRLEYEGVDVTAQVVVNPTP